MIVYYVSIELICALNVVGRSVIHMLQEQETMCIKDYQRRLLNMSDAKVVRTCNRHADCDKAEQEVKARWLEKHPGDPLIFVHPNFHCHDDECEECFGN